MLFEIGDIVGSKKYLTEAALMVGDDIDRIEAIAKLCFEFNFLDEAERILKKVYDEGIRELKVFNQFGLMSKEKKEYEKARSYYNAALQISPNSDVVNYNCAVLFVEMKEYKLAMAHLKRAILHHSEFQAGLELLERLEEFINSGKVVSNPQFGPLDSLQPALENVK